MTNTPTFEDLRPLVAALRAMQRHCKPFGPDYDAIAISLAALDEAAEIVTGESRFYATSGDHR